MSVDRLTYASIEGNRDCSETVKPTASVNHLFNVHSKDLKSTYLILNTDGVAFRLEVFDFLLDLAGGSTSLFEGPDTVQKQ